MQNRDPQYRIPQHASNLRTDLRKVLDRPVRLVYRILFIF